MNESMIGSNDAAAVQLDARCDLRRQAPQCMIGTMAKQTVCTMGSPLGQQILRGMLGGILGGRR